MKGRDIRSTAPAYNSAIVMTKEITPSSLPGRESHQVNVRDKPGFLHRMMIELAGVARMSLEGDLSQCKFPDDLVVSREPIGILRRNTLYPPQDFVVLRLTRQSVDSIFKQVQTAGLKRAIIHVLIERDGVQEMVANDNFHAECVGTGPGISSGVLAELKAKGVLRDFKPAPEPAHRSPAEG
jgi:hypothetical protein